MSDDSASVGWVEDFERSLTSPDPTERLRAVVADLIAAGADRERVQEQLELFRGQLRSHDRDADEDIVLEVLDFLTGWCSPHQRIE